MKGFKFSKAGFFCLLLICAQLGFAQVSDSVEPNEININQADAETIALVLNGIGLSKAQAIVSYRDENGDFESIEELVLVKGIGEATVVKNQDKILFK